VSQRTGMLRLADRGQSVWLDYIRRDLMESGELAAMVGGGLKGMTSNPSIFQKAIAGSDLYDDDLATLLAADPDAGPSTLFEQLAIVDIRLAADELLSVYERSDGADGLVSLEVSPHLAHDTEATIVDAHRLWAAVDRPNLMIKVPATPAGIPAIERLIGDGVNVNVTLMFSLGHYEAVAHAFLRGLEQTADPSRIASVASFFVSRVDTAVEAAIEQLGDPRADALAGKVAVANSRVTYGRFQALFGDDFEANWGRGAFPQRVLWASTSTKNPAYSDVLYVEELIGPHTVNTLPPATLEAFEDHGEVRGDTLCDNVDEAHAVLDELAVLGIDFVEITEQLQDAGVQAFIDSYDDLIDTIATKRDQLLA